MRPRRARPILSSPDGHKEIALRIPATLALTLAAALGGCTGAEAPGPSRAGGSDCVQLFQSYDLAEAIMSTPSGRADRMPIPPDLQLPGIRLRSAGCITLSADLAGMNTVAAAPVTDGGAAIRPTRVHAGAVTNMADDSGSQAFFEAHGVPARSAGSPALGRRIYIGPFHTQGALDGATALARAAGFASPYPVGPF